MSKINRAIYPGSFNPFHEGHKSIVKQLYDTKLFDQITIAVGVNPDKDNSDFDKQIKQIRSMIPEFGTFVYIDTYSGLLKDFIKEQGSVRAIIKGIRDSQDFLYEQKMQYHNEDLGITIPTFYVIADRKLVHVSSSAIRTLEKFKK